MFSTHGRHELNTPLVDNPSNDHLSTLLAGFRLVRIGHARPIQNV